MKKLEKLLKSHKNIVFLDFEGTQFSHEMIAIGAVSCTIGRDNKIKKMKKPFRIYVKARNKVGKYVTNLTGITDEKIAKEGVNFSRAIMELKKYVGKPFKKSSFLTFGNHDLKILGQSIAYSLDFPKEECSIIQKNYVDYALFLSEFVKDGNGNPLSLVHYCELFQVKLAEPAHDPAVDALNLANLYNAFLIQKTLVMDEYKKVLPKAHNMPQPVSDLVKSVLDGNKVDIVDFEKFIRDYLE